MVVAGSIGLSGPREVPRIIDGERAVLVGRRACRRDPADRRLPPGCADGAAVGRPPVPEPGATGASRARLGHGRPRSSTSADPRPPSSLVLNQFIQFFVV